MVRNNSISYQPLPVTEFRKLKGLSNYAIPEVPEKRKATDVAFTVAFGLTLVLSLGFLIHALIKADINRLTHGYDNCGNVCGSRNPNIDEVPCSGKDWTFKPYLQIVPIRTFISNDTVYRFGTCVQKCKKNWVKTFNRCYPASNQDHDQDDEIFKDIADGLNRSAGYIVLFCLLGLGFSIGMLLLFRFLTAITIWVVLGGSVLGVVAMAVAFWLADAKSADDPHFNPNRPFRPFAIIFTTSSLVIIILFIALFKRIKLIIRLFKEAVKIIFSMPLILLEPFLTSMATFILIVLFWVFIFQIESAGTLHGVIYNYLYEYRMTGVMVFTLCLHILASLWMAQFITGCQHMVIAGAVSARYFARDKSRLKSPIYTSIKNLVRFHLGTVAFGSLIMMLIAMIKATIRALVNRRYAKVTKVFVDCCCCLGPIDNFLRYLSKNAYIETAIHGQPFYKSGKRAVHLLTANAVNAIAVNYVGDFVIFMAKFFIVTLTVTVGCLARDDSNEYFGLGIAIAGVVTFIIANCFFTVLEMAIDTIFICFCEDSCINDGMIRPYYMSRDLRLYVEDAKIQEKKR